MIWEGDNQDGSARLAKVEVKDAGEGPWKAGKAKEEQQQHWLQCSGSPDKVQRRVATMMDSVQLKCGDAVQRVVVKEGNWTFAQSLSQSLQYDHVKFPTMAAKGWWGWSQWMWALQKGAGVNSKPAEGFRELGDVESFWEAGGRHLGTWPPPRGAPCQTLQKQV